MGRGGFQRSDPSGGAAKGMPRNSKLPFQALARIAPAATLTAFAFFIAYGVMSLPGAAILARLRSVPTVLISLGAMVAGCLIMMIAVKESLYPVILLGLFVLASGITVLQVAANPHAAALGR